MSFTDKLDRGFMKYIKTECVLRTHIIHTVFTFLVFVFPLSKFITSTVREREREERGKLEFLDESPHFLPFLIFFSSLILSIKLKFLQPLRKILFTVYWILFSTLHYRPIYTEKWVRRDETSTCAGENDDGTLNV